MSAPPSLVEELTFQRLHHLMQGRDRAAAEVQLTIDQLLARALMGERARHRLLERAERAACARLAAASNAPLDDDSPVPRAVVDLTGDFVHQLPTGPACGKKKKKKPNKH
mgnify:CR=1 FL=1